MISLDKQIRNMVDGSKFFYPGLEVTIFRKVDTPLQQSIYAANAENVMRVFNTLDGYVLVCTSNKTLLVNAEKLATYGSTSFSDEIQGCPYLNDYNSKWPIIVEQNCQGPLVAAFFVGTCHGVKGIYKFDSSRKLLLLLHAFYSTSVEVPSLAYREKDSTLFFAVNDNLSTSLYSCEVSLDGDIASTPRQVYYNISTSAKISSILLADDLDGEYSLLDCVVLFMSDGTIQCSMKGANSTLLSLYGSTTYGDCTVYLHLKIADTDWCATSYGMMSDGILVVGEAPAVKNFVFEDGKIWYGNAIGEVHTIDVETGLDTYVTTVNDGLSVNAVQIANGILFAATSGSLQYYVDGRWYEYTSDGSSLSCGQMAKSHFLGNLTSYDILYAACKAEKDDSIDPYLAVLSVGKPDYYMSDVAADLMSAVYPTPDPISAHSMQLFSFVDADDHTSHFCVLSLTGENCTFDDITAKKNIAIWDESSFHGLFRPHGIDNKIVVFARANCYIYDLSDFSNITWRTYRIDSSFTDALGFGNGINFIVKTGVFVDDTHMLLIVCGTAANALSKIVYAEVSLANACILTNGLPDSALPIGSPAYTDIVLSNDRYYALSGSNDDSYSSFIKEFKPGYAAGEFELTGTLGSTNMQLSAALSDLMYTQSLFPGTEILRTKQDVKYADGRYSDVSVLQRVDFIGTHPTGLNALSTRLSAMTSLICMTEGGPEVLSCALVQLPAQINKFHEQPKYVKFAPYIDNLYIPCALVFSNKAIRLITTYGSNGSGNVITKPTSFMEAVSKLPNVLLCGMDSPTNNTRTMVVTDSEQRRHYLNTINITSAYISDACIESVVKVNDEQTPYIEVSIIYASTKDNGSVRRAGIKITQNQFSNLSRLSGEHGELSCTLLSNDNGVYGNCICPIHKQDGTNITLVSSGNKLYSLSSNSSTREYSIDPELIAEFPGQIYSINEVFNKKIDGAVEDGNEFLNSTLPSLDSIYAMPDGIVPKVDKTYAISARTYNVDLSSYVVIATRGEGSLDSNEDDMLYAVDIGNVLLSALYEAINLPYITVGMLSSFISYPFYANLLPYSMFNSIFESLTIPYANDSIVFRGKPSVEHGHMKEFSYLEHLFASSPAECFGILSNCNVTQLKVDSHDSIYLLPRSSNSVSAWISNLLVDANMPANAIDNLSIFFDHISEDAKFYYLTKSGNLAFALYDSTTSSFSHHMLSTYAKVASDVVGDNARYPYLAVDMQNGLMQVQTFAYERLLDFSSWDFGEYGFAKMAGMPMSIAFAGNAANDVVVQTDNSDGSNLFSYQYASNLILPVALEHFDSLFFANSVYDNSHFVVCFDTLQQEMSVIIDVSNPLNALHIQRNSIIGQLISLNAFSPTWLTYDYSSDVYRMFGTAQFSNISGLTALEIDFSGKMYDGTNMLFTFSEQTTGQYGVIGTVAMGNNLYIATTPEGVYKYKFAYDMGYLADICYKTYDALMCCPPSKFLKQILTIYTASSGNRILSSSLGFVWNLMLSVGLDEAPLSCYAHYNANTHFAGKGILDEQYANDNTLFYTKYTYRIFNDTPEFTVESAMAVYEEYKDAISLSVSDTMASHISAMHNANSPITLLNLYMPTTFPMPESFKTPTYHSYSEALNDYIERIIVGDSSNGSITALAINMTMQGKSWKKIDLNYIIKQWKSGIMEMYIYLPTTYTYYIPHVLGVGYCAGDGVVTLANGCTVTTSVAENATHIQLEILSSSFYIDPDVGLLEQTIKGNSLPLKIYKDTTYSEQEGYATDMYHSFILPSIAQQPDLSKMSNGKYVLDFWCFGSDALAIKLVVYDPKQNFLKKFKAVVYHGNGGFTQESSPTDVMTLRILKGSSTALPIYWDVFAAEGAVFLGWSTNMNADTPDYDNYSEYAAFMYDDIAGDSLHLYAIWTFYKFGPNDTAITLQNNGLSTYTIAELTIDPTIVHADNPPLKNKLVMSFED